MKFSGLKNRQIHVDGNRFVRWLWPLVVVGVVGIGAWFLVGFSRIDLNVPMNYEHDAFEYAMVSQTVNQTGGYMTNDHLGAPFGQDLHDFPYGADNLNIAALRVLNGITGNPGLSLNLLYFVQL